MNWHIDLENVEQTKALAKCMAEFLKPGMVLCLTGDLGAGKTTFTQALAKALGITEHVSSPTFTLVHEYHSGRVPLYHMDVYRVEEPEELEYIGFDEYFAQTAIVVVEWAERVEELLPKERIHLGLYRRTEENHRIMTINGDTNLGEKMIGWLETHWKGTIHADTSN